MNNPVGGTFDKVDAILDAYSQLRISGITVTPSPEDLELALNRLEGMAAEWFERNINANYKFEDQPDPNSPSGVRLGFKQAFATNLALRLVPDFNKQLGPVLAGQARQSLSNLSASSAREILKQIPYPTRQAVGSGNEVKYARWYRFYSGNNGAPSSSKTNQMFIGDADSFVEHFEAYLNDNETIASFDISSTSGLDIQSSAISGSDITYDIEVTSPSESEGSAQYVVITITTDAARVETRVIWFETTRRPRTP